LTHVNIVVSYRIASNKNRLGNGLSRNAYLITTVVAKASLAYNAKATRHNVLANEALNDRDRVILSADYRPTLLCGAF